SSVSPSPGSSGSVGGTESAAARESMEAARASAESNCRQGEQSAMWASSGFMRCAARDPQTNATMSSSFGQVLPPGSCCIQLWPSAAPQAAKADIELTPDHAHDAIQILRMDLQPRHHLCSCGFEHEPPRADDEAGCRRPMHPIELAELVDREAVD